jgi:hypothetical protein
MNKKIAIAAAAAAFLGLGASTAVFADDIDRQLSTASSEVQTDMAKSDGSDADGWIAVRTWGWGVRPAVVVRPAIVAPAPRLWVPGYWHWRYGYVRGYWR